MANFRLPGSVCGYLNDNDFDAGTMCRQRSRPPGSQKDPEAVAAEKRAWYLRYAYSVSYAMQGQSLAQEGINEVDEALDSVLELWDDAVEYVTEEEQPERPRRKPKNVQSVLGGKFLRMYLDGQVDPEAVTAAGKEMAAAPKFEQLEKGLNKSLQRRVRKKGGRKLTEKELGKYARIHLRYKRKKGIAFRKTLNPVIGGVSDIEVGKTARIINEEETEEGWKIDYEVDVTFIDTYDFDNTRTGVYDRYRKRLARLLMRNDFDRFERMYGRESHSTFYRDGRKNELTDAGLFASFMYALEKKGWTPGPLAWQVTLPMRGTIVEQRSRGGRGRRSR